MARVSAFAALLGRPPFIYLGVPIFKGKPRKVHLMSNDNCIKTKLSTQKGVITSIMGTGATSEQYYPQYAFI